MTKNFISASQRPDKSCCVPTKSLPESEKEDFVLNVYVFGLQTFVANSEDEVYCLRFLIFDR